MLGSTVHGLPLLNGYTAYQPPHRQLLLRAVGRLPATDALDDLVDLGHLRFILLRPPEYWRDARLRDGLAALPGVRPVLARDGWLLLRVDRTPRHPQWFAAIAAGTGPDETALGTPLAPLDPTRAAAHVSARGLPNLLLAGTPVVVELDVRNAGAATWPVAAPPRRALTGTSARRPADLARPGVVRLLAQWRTLPGGAASAPPVPLALPRDVAPGESVRLRAVLKTPAAPGAHELAIGASQARGAPFGDPGNAPLRRRVTVVAPADAQGRRATACVGRGAYTARVMGRVRRSPRTASSIRSRATST